MEKRQASNQEEHMQANKQSLMDAKRFMLEHDNFLVVSHVQPDGDAIGSTCAIGLMLKHLQKNYTMINESPVPKKYVYMPDQEQIICSQEENVSQKFKYVISIDCADLARMGNVSKLFTDDVQLLNIDHHATNDGFGHINLINVNAAATTEVLCDLIETLKIPWDLPLATSIYTGLLTDTGGFRYSNTSPKVMEMASFLLKQGVQGSWLAERLLESISYEHIQLLKVALETLSFTADRKISWMSVSLDDLAQTHATEADLDGLINYPRNIEGVEVGMLFKQVAEQSVKVSFRSNSEFDVSALAQQFGGGGHQRAAGCTIHASVDEAIESVVQYLKDVYK